MAKRKTSKQRSLMGVLITAALIGAVIGAVIFYDPGEPLPGPDSIEFTDEYDDEWGRLPAPIARCSVTHILLMIDDKRTEEEAKEQIEKIWHQYKNNPTKENWTALQAKHNEDTGDKHRVYPIPGDWVPEFLETGKTTEIGFARICKTSYGYHLIRREN